MAPRKSKYGKKAFKPRARKPKRKSGFAKSVAKIAQKVVNKNVEDKVMYQSTSESALVNFNSTISNIGDYMQLIPNCTSNADENGRVGDELTVKKFEVKGYIRFNPVFNMSTADPKACQVGVRMMILSLKKTASWDLVTSTSTPLNSLLRRGGTTVGFSGQIADLHNDINTDLFTVHHNKVFYMSQQFVGNSSTTGWFSSEIKDQIRFFKFSMKCKNKKLIYDDDTNSGLLPTNYAPFMLLGYSFLNGSAADTVSTNLGLQLQSYIYYQDA